MKLTKQQLKQIITEEVAAVLNEITPSDPTIRKAARMHSRKKLADLSNVELIIQLQRKHGNLGDWKQQREFNECVARGKKEVDCRGRGYKEAVQGCKRSGYLGAHPCLYEALGLGGKKWRCIDKHGDALIHRGGHPWPAGTQCDTRYDRGEGRPKTAAEPGAPQPAVGQQQQGGKDDCVYKCKFLNKCKTKGPGCVSDCEDWCKRQGQGR